LRSGIRGRGTLGRARRFQGSDSSCRKHQVRSCGRAT
jgi:hypothetical protein